ncbi:MAG: hypothetical protein ACKOPE_13295 [Novosphingobium sp.]
MSATYLAFSVRTLLDTVNPGELFSLKRFIATGVGAAAFVAVALPTRKAPERELSARLASVLLLSAAGAALVLAVRIGYDLIVADHVDAILQRNVRWIITWFGYFSATVASYIAILFARRARRQELSDRPFSRPEIAAALVAEVSQWNADERRALIESLDQAAAYVQADPIEFCRTPGLG